MRSADTLSTRARTTRAAMETSAASLRYAMVAPYVVSLSDAATRKVIRTGRALAHRLKSKFFLIDGTVIAGSGDFYCKVREIFDEAKRNAPSIIFIDDTDVIFEGDEDKGFYRYLLTMLDGLESRDLCARSRSTNDRRSHVLVLTDKGRAVLVRAKKLVAAKHEARLNELLGPANRAALLAMLATIAKEF